ncbi:XrtA/PEP-CTERM system histidine kinase PrsK [Sphingorhabdus sp. Alg239-R122]|uniref:XrtA/PEP-CTERM system histidine kinase PrsK n=1 Tax=Sphingorhabdus sp. Alg239-R122 TaxID=2305989 RepID=UPI0013DA7C99|nr:XrtA/PEP-CTERM system histidine kinase PrsK [Sphingorhabdus sp. Alg239-R122]
MNPQIWSHIDFWSHIGAAFFGAAIVIWLWQRHGRSASHIHMLIVAVAFTSLWSLVHAINGHMAVLTIFAEIVRNFAWLAFMYSLFRSGGKNTGPKTVTAIYYVLGTILMAQIAIDSLGIFFNIEGKSAQLVLYSGIVMRMLFVVGALVLVHNLHTLSSLTKQAWARLPVLGLAILWVYDLNLYTIAYLSGELSPELMALRGAMCVFVIPLFAFTTQRGEARPVHLSRSMAFQSFSLVAIGGYLAVMVLLAKVIQLIGGDYARLAQISIVFGMSMAALFFLPSGKYRAWFKVKIAKHLYQHRYDYRSEWMRFTDTIGRPSADSAPFHERVIQAVADIPESPAGLLLTPNENGRLELQARWNWPAIKVPANACKAGTMAYFERTGDIVELARLRSGDDEHCDVQAVPAWLLSEQSAWVLVPLVHYNRLAGLVVLSRPPFMRTLDWEDFDMLRVVGRQLASYLAEEKGQEALLQSRQFDEFNRRFAFVMHDIKNIVSQLSLVARNAEKHANNPDFRADMVDTLRGSVDRMNGLLAKLSQYGRTPSDESAHVDTLAIIRKVADEKSPAHDVRVLGMETMSVTANADNLEQVVSHIVQNAIDASGEGQPVMLKNYRDGLFGCIEVFDTGEGMTADFVRSKLFKPFVSSKNDGFGIGAYEARTLVEAMQGRIEVESRAGEGSRFTIRLPLAKYDDAPEENLEQKEKAA